MRWAGKYRARHWQSFGSSSALTERAAILSHDVELPGAAPHKEAPQISTVDVDGFYSADDAAGGDTGAGPFQSWYLDAGSIGSRQFARDSIHTGERLARSISGKPATFSDARRCVLALPAVRSRLGRAPARLQQDYPVAGFPPVTPLTGCGNTGGTSNSKGAVNGLETICSAPFMEADLKSRFVHLIAHEYVQVQLPAAQTEPVRPTILSALLVEGGAVVVGSLISDVGNYQFRQWKQGREAEIERTFAREKVSTDLGKWIWTGPGDAGHPRDLGYWVGYRFGRSCERKAPGKKAAVRAITPMQDLRTFFAVRSWKPASRQVHRWRSGCRARRSPSVIAIALMALCSGRTRILAVHCHTRGPARLCIVQCKSAGAPCH